MALNLSDYTTYQSYFSGLAASHVDITDFVFADDQEMANLVKGKKVQKILWLDPYESGQLIDNGRDNVLTQYPASLVIAAIKPQKYADQKTRYKECEDIVKDIIAKLWTDWTSGVVVSQLSSYKFGSREDNFGGTDLIGCKLDFTFLSPAGLMYNPAKWT